MKRTLLLILVIGISILTMAGLQAETGYFYGKGLELETPDGTCSLEGRLYALAHYDTEFEIGEYYGLVDLGLAGAILSEPLLMVYPKEAYIEGYLEDLDFKAGIFYNSFGSGMVLNPVNLFAKKGASGNLPMNGLELDYGLNNGNLSGYIFTSMDEDVDLQLIADFLAELKSGNLSFANDPEWKFHTGVAGRLDYNFSGIDTIFTVAYDKTDETITATKTVNGNETLVSDKPYMLKVGGEAVAQIPGTAFIIHTEASLGIDSDVLLLDGNSDLGGTVKKTIDSIKGVAGIEYQAGTTGLIGIEGYYDSEPGFGVYGNYSKSNWQVKGMGKGALKSGNIVMSLMGEIDYKLSETGTIFSKITCGGTDNNLLVFTGVKLII